MTEKFGLSKSAIGNHIHLNLTSMCGFSLPPPPLDFNPNLQTNALHTSMGTLTHTCVLPVATTRILLKQPIIPGVSVDSLLIGCSPSVSRYGHRVVQWSPLHIRQDTSFWPWSFFRGSSSGCSSCCHAEEQQEESSWVNLQVDTNTRFQAFFWREKHGRMQMQKLLHPSTLQPAAVIQTQN